MVARDLRIARYEGQPIHLCHLHVAESVEEVRLARALGVDVSAEASPHHLLLTDDDVRTLDPNLRMSPPLAAEADRQALIEALRDGTIDCVATDHAPHAREEKEVPFEAAANGTIGLETAFPALFHGLVEPGLLDLATLVTRMTDGPGARVRAARHRASRVGEPASFALWDLDERYVVARVRPPLAQPQLRLPRSRGRRALPAHRSPSGQVAHRLAAGGRVTAGSALPRRRHGLARRRRVGAEACAVGEAVFTTGMTGYQESLTDPSFYGQLLCFTAPMIGNYGVEESAPESPGVQVRALLCHEARNAAPSGRRGSARLAARAGRRRARRDRHARARPPPARSRRDARGGRRRRALRGRGPRAARGRAADDRPLARRRGVRPDRRATAPDGAATSSSSTTARRPRSCTCSSRPAPSVEVVRHDASAAEILALEPDGVLLANGPGDPGAMDAHVARGARADRQRPAGLRHLPRPPAASAGRSGSRRSSCRSAIAARTTRCSSARPVACSSRARTTASRCASPTRARRPRSTSRTCSLYDHTVEGLRLRGRPVWSMQFHPEASPGPHDARDRARARSSRPARACASARGWRPSDAATRRSPRRSP